MFPYPPPSSDELLRSPNVRLLDNLAPLAFSSVRVPGVDEIQFLPLVCAGLPHTVDDPQAVERGKYVATDATTDTSKGMKIDDHPRASYAGIVSEFGRQVASNMVPSLNDVIVESGDVMLDRTCPFSSISFSKKVHEHIDHSPSVRQVGATFSRSTPGEHDHAAMTGLQGTGGSLPESPGVSNPVHLASKLDY
ncbi:hypothetical protein V6N13_029745 [Hibiscus sabdariffa]|uniref:Uncharacterized protein n=1 Tax=Hibiscus sabdariffa TaxID=183260 RepID=A0ABR2T926_9ROSI